jgi:hypothetical protein
MVGSAYRSVEAGSFELASQERLGFPAGSPSLGHGGAPLINGAACLISDLTHLAIGTSNHPGRCVLD